ncbi:MULTISPECIES: OmpA family protein [unclassified Corallococcus]|uniref:OmpA family protein n=1 Tax=unclassified Corallococcus TaxID=2685029 RepID=UPI001CBBFB7D|nr:MULTISPECIES: OmpA family protein [unclassified Corallococcus]MBZ4336464.1 OmpA family protein [Corallococcus sp. AS-1-12]MBZ4374453.1 OmpA family protein [Corallococcus sp. AS-1-6]
MQRWKLGWLAVAGVTALSVGCAHGPPPSELTAARQAYREVSTSPEGRERPADVAAARAALQEAENEYAESRGSVRTRSLAYVALRKAEIASARGEADLAAQQRAQAEASLREQQEARAQNLTRQQEEERARYEAQRQQYEQQRQQFEAQRQQLDAQRQQEAERLRAADAQQRQQMEAEMQRRLEQQQAEAQRLAELNQQLQQRTQELEQERQARLQAEQRASQALTRLQDENVKVREEARGTVVTLSGSVLFATNATELLPAARDRLSEVATALKESKNPLLIEGHTDSRGSEDYNDQLSERRAESVRNFLVNQGVPADRIQIRGMGENRPVASNSTAEGRANNRRVEIVVERNVAGAQPSRSGGVGGSGAQQPPPQGDQDQGQNAQPDGTGGSGTDAQPHGAGVDHQSPQPEQGSGDGAAKQQVPQQPMDHGQ